MSVKIVALLPIKENSQRIPNKNIKDFNGYPLFMTILSTLTNSDYISKIVINTDSDLIISMVSDYSKVKIHRRPAEIQGDLVSMNEIINYDLSILDEEYFLQTHSTNPLLKTETIDRAIKFFMHNNEQFDSLFSVTKLQTRLYSAIGKPINHDPEHLLQTQDLEPIFEENSNFYIFSKSSFINSEKKRIGLSPFMFEIPKTEAVDIDENEDFELAEILFKLRNESKN